MKNTVYFGFIAVILLVTLLAFAWLAQIKNSNKAVLDLVEQSDIKINHAQIMLTTVRKRQILLFSMLVTDDAFELDEKIQEFYTIAADYGMARTALKKLPMTESERYIHKMLDAQILRALPENNLAVEMFADDKPKDDIAEVIQTARQYQSELIESLDHFVTLQKSKYTKAITTSRKMHDDSIYWISLWGLITVAFIILISRYVGRAVTEKNEELRLAGEKMTKAYKKAEEARILKSEFLATMSHEIRTPLTAIIGFAETTLFSDQSMEQRLSSIQTIIRSGKHLLQIINDILDLSKVEANKLEIEYSEASLFEMLDYIEHLERPAADEKEINFSVNYTYPLPTKVKIDELRVKQIVLNLCNNAIKFTEVGHVTINISCNNEDSSLLFEVNDSGIGISEKQQALIFQPYRQVDSSTTRKFGGTGLGLTLSKLLAERMGGTLTFESKFGQGSSFKFYLPFEKNSDELIVSDKEDTSCKSEKSIDDISTEKLSGNILLAEDNIDNQELFSIFLERIGVDVTIAENGKIAVEATEKHDFDLILMDIQMPVMGGIEAVKLLRKKNFKKPIVAVTANAMIEDRKDCLDAGCDDFLAKPVNAEKFSQILEKYLDINVAKSSNKASMVSTLLKEDPDLINLVKKFVASLPDTLAQIEELVKNVNWEELSNVLHKLKGTSGNFGFGEVSSLVSKMEFQVANKNKSELMELLMKLKENHQQILSGLE